MFDQAPWTPAPAEEPTGSWTPVPAPGEADPPAPAPEQQASGPFSSGFPAPELPAPAAPRQGEATEWWTPALDAPSGPTPLPPQQAWSPRALSAAPEIPEAPSVPIVPDSWFAGPVQEQASGGSGEFRQVQTGPFTPVFDGAGQGRPAEPPAAFSADSTFAAMGPPDPGAARPEEQDPYARPGGPVSEPPYVQPDGFESAPPHDRSDGFESPPSYGWPEPAQPEGPVSEHPYAQPGGFTAAQPYAQPEYGRQSEYGRTEYFQPEHGRPEYPRPDGLAAEPPYAQPNGLAAEPPYAAQQPGEPPYGQPQAGFAPAAQLGMMGGSGGSGGFGQQQPWGGPQEEKPLWDPNGPLPMTQSHRAPSADGGAKNKPLLIGVAALVVVALVSVCLVFFDGDDDPKSKIAPSQRPVAQVPAGERTTDPAAVKQARKVQALLNASAKSRGALSDALVKARKCAAIPASVNTMQQVAQQRQAQWKRAQQLNIPQLPEAVKLRAALARSIKLSLDVDLAYLAWARSNQGCKGKTPLKGANYKRGDRLSAQASRSKNRFLEMWNPIAPRYGLAKRQSF
ncbi:hypothetical protein [Actinocorallia aurantiaca]